jgi:hypothetical protein
VIAIARQSLRGCRCHGVVWQPPSRGVQLDSQLAAPPQVSWQPSRQPVMAQRPVPERQVSWQPPPGQSRTHASALVQLI